MHNESNLASVTTYCPNCSYHLRGLPVSADGSIGCPECGQAFSAALLAESQIPWSHRTKIGRRRAFGKTVRLAIFHPRKIAAQVANPVSLADAQSFRRVVILLNFLPVCLLFAGDFVSRMAAIGHLRRIDILTDEVGLLEVAQFHPGADTFGMLYNGLLSVGLIIPDPLNILAFLIGLLLFLISVTGVHTYFFHPRGLPIIVQNRTIALAYYAVAPLAFGPLAMLFASAGFLLLPWIFSYLSLPLRLLAYLGAFGPAVLCIATMWVDALSLLRYSTRCSFGRILTCAILWPILWITLFAVAFGIPLALGVLITFMVQTMR